MNDFVRHLKFKVGNRFGFEEADALEDMLSEIPMGALKYQYPVGALKYQYPVEVAAAAFNTGQDRLADAAD
jgi:hypothetical protein